MKVWIIALLFWATPCFAGLHIFLAPEVYAAYDRRAESGTTYVLRVTKPDGETVYKFGITGNTVAQRYRYEKLAGHQYKVLGYVTMSPATCAPRLEKWFHLQYGRYAYKGTRVFRNTKNTEVVTVNPVRSLKNIPVGCVVEESK